MSNYVRTKMFDSVVDERKWQQMFRASAATEQLGRCKYCGEALTRETISADHAVPRSKGGPTSRQNIKAACIPCNMAKGSMSVAEFMEAIARPPEGASIHIWLAWSRRRLRIRVDRFRDRLSRAVGMVLP